MKFVDSLNKRRITIIGAFKYLNKTPPDYYFRMPPKLLREWMQRELEFTDAVKYVKRVLNVRI